MAVVTSKRNADAVEMAHNVGGKRKNILRLLIRWILFDDDG